MSNLYKRSSNKLAIFHIDDTTLRFALSHFLLFNLNITLTWNFALFPKIVLNSIIKIATRYCYVLLVLSHDQISLLCLNQAFKVSLHQNSKACPHHWSSQVCFDFSHLWGNFLTCGNIGNIIGGSSKLTDLICNTDISEIFFPQFLCFWDAWELLSKLPEIFWGRTRYLDLPLNQLVLISKIKSLH